MKKKKTSFCIQCKKEKPIIEFGVNQYGETDWICKECKKKLLFKEKTEKQQKVNPDYYVEMSERMKDDGEA